MKLRKVSAILIAAVLALGTVTLIAANDNDTEDILYERCTNEEKVHTDTMPKGVFSCCITTHSTPPGSVQCMCPPSDGNSWTRPCPCFPD